MVINIKKIFTLLKRDLLYGFKNNFLRFILSAVFFAAINFLEASKAASNGKINGTEFFFEIYKGAPFPGKESLMPPAIWLMILCLMLFITGSFFYDDLKKNGIYILTRTESKKYFFISKVLWVVINVLFFYAIIFSITIISGIFLGGYPRTVLLCGIKINSIKLISMTFLLYVTSSIALSLFQGTFSLLIKPAYAYLITFMVTFASVYTENILLPGQHLLILRHFPFDVFHGLTLQVSVMYSLIVSAFSLMLSYAIFNKKDIY